MRTVDQFSLLLYSFDFYRTHLKQYLLYLKILIYL